MWGDFQGGLFKSSPDRNKASYLGEHAAAYETAKRRLIFLCAILLLAYSLVCYRLIDLAIFRDKSQISVQLKDAKKKENVAGMRADILDRNGDLIASSLRMSSAFADTTMVDNPEELADKIKEVLPDLDHEELLNKLKSGKKFIWIKRNITPKQKYNLNAIGEPSLSFSDDSKRIYPNGNLAAHVIGYTDIDGNGIAGIEKYYDERLRTSEEPMQLSIDLKVQHAVRSELLESMAKFKAKAAIGMVMDVETGEIISMVSLPDFDPNNMEVSTAEQRFNRASLGVFEMGSTFKLFSTAAALDSGKVNFNTSFDVSQPIKISGFTISDSHHIDRSLTVPEVFIYSSNIGTSKMAEVLGTENVERFYRSMGFFDKVQELEVPERGGTIYPSPWREVNTMTVSFGHGIAVSPVHLMKASSALVNGGIMPKATLIKLKDTNVQSDPNVVTEANRVISEETSKKLRQLLELVVVGGTGNNAFVDGYSIGGKTGTAEKNINGKYEKNVLFSSFLGFFPITKPKYAVLAILDEPHSLPGDPNSPTGGWTAAPVVAKIVKHMGSIYQIPPDNHSFKNIEREMGRYLKDFKEGRQIVSVGIDR